MSELFLSFAEFLFSDFPFAVALQKIYNACFDMDEKTCRKALFQRLSTESKKH